MWLLEQFRSWRSQKQPRERLCVIVISAIMTRCRDADVWGDADVTFTMRHNMRYSVIFREIGERSYLRRAGVLCSQSPVYTISLVFPRCDIWHDVVSAVCCLAPSSANQRPGVPTVGQSEAQDGLSLKVSLYAAALTVKYSTTWEWEECQVLFLVIRI